MHPEGGNLWGHRAPPDRAPGSCEHQAPPLALRALGSRIPVCWPGSVRHGCRVCVVTHSGVEMVMCSRRIGSPPPLALHRVHRPPARTLHHAITRRQWPAPPDAGGPCQTLQGHLADLPQKRVRLYRLPFPLPLPLPFLEEKGNLPAVRCSPAASRSADSRKPSISMAGRLMAARAPKLWNSASNAPSEPVLRVGGWSGPAAPCRVTPPAAGGSPAPPPCPGPRRRGCR